MSCRPIDHRPKRGAWAPGDYISKCHKCSCNFFGDKQAVECAVCAYGSFVPTSPDDASKSNIASSVGTIAIPSPYPLIAINDEHERNEFARAALIGILGCDGRPDGDDAKVEWAFTLADKMSRRSKVKPQS